MTITVYDLILPVVFFPHGERIGARTPHYPDVVALADTTSEAAVALRWAVIDRIDSAVARQRGEELAAAGNHA